MKWIVILAAGAACAGASADVYSWNWNSSDARGYNDRGGAFDSVFSSFNSDTNRLVWEATFFNQITDGFTLALNNGPNPKGHAGELGLLYFDATDVENIRVSSYAYNGMNALTSYRDGSPLTGTQQPDVIFGASPSGGTPSPVLLASVTDANGGRTFRLELDTTVINTHSPAYPGGQGPEEWYGMRYDNLLGVWFHPLTSLATEYTEEGTLSFWSGRQGWLDGTGYETTVPAPGVAVAGLFGAGLITGKRRRRTVE